MTAIGPVARRRLTPPALIAVVLVGLGHVVVATVAVALGVVMTHVALVAPDRAHRIDATIARGAHRLGAVVGAVALGALWAVVVVPAHAVARLVRRDPLSASGRWRAHLHHDDADHTDLFTVEPRLAAPPSAAARLATAVPLVLGWAVLAVGANYALGWLWDDVVGSHDQPAAVALAPEVDPVVLAGRPALADAGWAEEHLRSHQQLEYRYEPFLLAQLEDGTYGDIVIKDGQRRSWAPPAATAATPEVWVFGGSTTFGKGQRDDHTVASELARLAAADGRPVRVRNLASPAHTSYHEWMLFERHLAEGPPPALAVFLGGTADIEVQLEWPSADPTHFNRARVDQNVTQGPDEPSVLDDPLDRYLDDSLVRRTWLRLEDLLGIEPAGADGPGIADNAADLGERARFLVDHLAEQEGVAVLHVREPAPIGGPGRSAYLEVSAGLPGEVVDLTDLLVGEDDLYLDWIHVNEEGARRIAAALWDEVSARLPD